MKKQIRSILAVTVSFVLMVPLFTSCKPNNKVRSSSQSTSSVVDGESVDSSIEDMDSSDASQTTAEAAAPTAGGSRGTATRGRSGSSGGSSSVPVGNYVIVQSASASRTVKKACTELQSYLKQIYGVKLSIVNDNTAASSMEIAVGKTKRKGSAYTVDSSRIKNDGYEIKKSGNTILIAGNIDRGALYGVFGFLEKYCGCGFYAEGVEKVPTAKAMSLPASISYIDNPALPYRGVDWGCTYDSLTSVKLRINDGHNRTLGATAGGGIDYAGGLFVHTYNALADPNLYFKNHPEYYALVNGKRDPEQLCLSNPGVLKVVIASSRII